MSAWKEYKKNLGETRPWDFLNYNTEYATEQLSEYRMNLCNSCEELTSITKQCRMCRCVMPMKVKLQQAKCPLDKW